MPKPEPTVPKITGLKGGEVNLAFRNAALSDVFESIGQSSGMNFVFDPEVDANRKITFSIKDKPVSEVLGMVTGGNGLAFVALDDDSVLIFPDQPEKVREHTPTVIKTFYLENAVGLEVRELLANILGIEGIFVDERLNILIVRDSPETVALAGTILKSLDLAEPEVVLELEVLEVTRNRLSEVGIRYPESIGFSVQGVEGAGRLTLPEFQNRNSSLARLQFNDPLAVLNLKSSKGDASLLANPRIRIRNNAVANVLVGERVPVITTTTTANVGTSESVNYLDVGLKLDIEPTISPNDEVSMFIDLEVSSIVGEVVRASGLQAYRVGTRNASTTLRVKDGDTQILGGLIQRDERQSASGLPFLKDLPVIGKLFSNNIQNGSDTEIILLITPRVVQNYPKGMLEGLEVRIKTPPTRQEGADRTAFRGVQNTSVRRSAGTSKRREGRRSRFQGESRSYGSSSTGRGFDSRSNSNSTRPFNVTPQGIPAR